MISIVPLTRALQEETRKWSRQETGAEAHMTPIDGTSEEHGAEPFLTAFRARLIDVMGETEVTVVVTRTTRER